MARPVCANCSIGQVPNSYPIRFATPVEVGDGNCAACIQERYKTLGEGVGSKDGTGFADRDQPYTWGRARKALRSSLNDSQFGRLLILRGKVQDRRIAHHVTTPDPDGL